MSFNSYTFIANETPTTLKWNYGPGNEEYLRELLEEGENPGHVHTDSPPTGAVIMWAGSAGSLPSTFLLCNGQAISRTTYSDLFAIIGTQFGSGDGSTTFNVPDLRDRVAIGAGTTYSLNSQGGNDSVSYSHSHIYLLTHDHGSHSHTVNNHNHTTGAHYHTAGSLRARVVGASGGTYFTEDSGYGGWTANSRVTGTYSTGSFGVTGAAHVVNQTDYGDGTTGGAAPGTNTASVSYSGNGSTSSGGSSIDVRQKYLGLYFVIKI